MTINVLAAVGLTIILVYGAPFKPLRALVSKTKMMKELVGCSLCMGTWVGFGFALWQNEWRYALIVPLAAWLADALHGKLSS